MYEYLSKADLKAPVPTPVEFEKDDPSNYHI